MGLANVKGHRDPVIGTETERSTLGDIGDPRMHNMIGDLGGSSNSTDRAVNHESWRPMLRQYQPQLAHSSGWECIVKLLKGSVLPDPASFQFLS